MVLHRSEAGKAKTLSFEEALASIEHKIDNTLRGGNSLIYTSVITGAVLYHKTDFLEYVINKYKQAGWNITRDTGNDQRENTSWDYLRFS
jgi:hypothetical protein